nr:biliverdin-producing heme oxygenase [Acinetobacter sp. Marseille-Q1620]
MTSFENSLAMRLKQETAADHEHMHQLMARAQVFDSRQQYAKFILAQYHFQKDIEYLFENDDIIKLISDLDIRGRSAAAALDLQDLNVYAEHQDLATRHVSYPEAIGWIYVSEGATLGAAFLFKQAQNELGLSAEFAARNLAAYPEGRAKVWKRFISEIDQADLNKEQRDLVIQGAKQGFKRFAELLDKFAASV